MGSAREVVQDGKTGFVVENNIESFVEALKKISKIDRKECRERVKNLFTKEEMTKNYLKIYYSLVG
jgi:glycosyltransferase involved in cell wall biosynthesis